MMIARARYVYGLFLWTPHSVDSFFSGFYSAVQRSSFLHTNSSVRMDSSSSAGLLVLAVGLAASVHAGTVCIWRGISIP